MTQSRYYTIAILMRQLVRNKHEACCSFACHGHERKQCKARITFQGLRESLVTSKCRGERGSLCTRCGALRGHCWCHCWWRWRDLRGWGGGRGQWHLPLGSCSSLLGSTDQCERTAASEVPLPMVGRYFTSCLAPAAVYRAAQHSRLEERACEVPWPMQRLPSCLASAAAVSRAWGHALA